MELNPKGLGNVATVTGGQEAPQKKSAVDESAESRELSENEVALADMLEWLLKELKDNAIAMRKECRWTTPVLIAIAVLWTLLDEPTLTGRYARSLKIGRRLFFAVPKISYQAFIKRLGRHTTSALALLKPLLRKRMSRSLASSFLLAGFALFGVDGSRLGMPRTNSNEERFSPLSARRKRARKGKGKGRKKPRSPSHSAAARTRAGNGKGKSAQSPQAWITTMWHAGTGLPWDWRIGPYNSSERAHMIEMLGDLPANAMVVADAGFVGYEYWKAISDSGRHFVVRVGGNVKLLKRLGVARESHQTVYLWPDNDAKKNQPPLVLRLIVVHDGKQAWYLVTSVLSKSALNDSAVAKVYAARWGVELFFRNFKQTFGCNKLRSRNAMNVETEANWSLMGLWAALLYAQITQHRHRIPPQKMSVAKVLQAYRAILREYKSPPDFGESLHELLVAAVIDNYARTNKSSRNHPRKRAHEKTGEPIIVDASTFQVQQAKQLHVA